MVWFVANWSGVLAVVATLLGVAVSISHLAHKDAVAAQIQAIEDVVSKLIPKA